MGGSDDTSGVIIVGGVIFIFMAQIMTLGWLWKHQPLSPPSAARSADLASRHHILLHSRDECAFVQDIRQYATLKKIVSTQTNGATDPRDFLGEACTEYMAANTSFWKNYDRMVKKIELDEYPHPNHKTIPVEFVSPYKGKCEVFNESLQDAAQAAALLWPDRFPTARQARFELCRHMDIADKYAETPVPGLQWTQIEEQLRHAANEAYLGQPIPEFVFSTAP